jgi:predicted ester cyclase
MAGVALAVAEPALPEHGSAAPPLPAHAAGAARQPTLRAERLTRALVGLCYNGGQLTALDTLVAVNFVSNDLPMGREDFRMLIRNLRTAFPDLNVSVDDIIATDQRVAVRLTLAGTHRGPYLSLAPTQRRVRWSVLAIYQVGTDGLLERRWLYGEANEPEAQLRR